MKKLPITTVYSFLTIDYWPELTELSTFKAPREVILREFGGQVLEGPAETVRVSDLDERGHYRRVATGWDALITTF